VDPLLSTGPSLLPLNSLTDDDQPPSPSGNSTVIDFKVLLPLPKKLVEQIRRWEYEDFTQLLDDYCQPEGFTFQPPTGGHILFIDQDQVESHRKQITNIIFSWLKGFSRYMAVLTSCDSTTPAYATGLMAHHHLIL